MIGKKVRLRQITKSDIPALIRLLKDKEISRFTYFPYPFTKANAEMILKMIGKTRRRQTGYYFGIEEIESGRLCGWLGLNSVDLRHKHCDIGYWLGKEFRGKGLMSDAIQLALDYAFKELKLVRVAAYVFPDNIASIKLLKRNGFTEEGYLRRLFKHRNRYKDCHLFAILKEEYKKIWS